MRTAVVGLAAPVCSHRTERHALALARHGEVDLVCPSNTALSSAIAATAAVHVHRLTGMRGPGGPDGGRRRRIALVSAAGTAWRGWRLFWRLMRLPRPDVLLVQTPPATPTLPVAWLVARLRGARFVVDWHNLDHTLLAVRLGDDHRAVRALRRRERRWGARADAHFAVSKAMAEWLKREYAITATVLYDRPTSAAARDASLSRDFKARQCRALGLEQIHTPLVLAPTTWTMQEDFDMLIEALERAERQLARDAAHADAQGKRLIVWMVGRGPGREAFDRRLARRSFAALAVRTLSLDADDYAAAVGAADLGLCLHQSSSGLDLPSEMADFRGAGVPASAFDYAPVLSEVLTDGCEGIAFRDAGALSSVLVDVTRGTQSAGDALPRARQWLAAHPAESWEDHWDRQAKPLFVSNGS
jgi:beta-1,4-mannosyltransferase